MSATIEKIKTDIAELKQELSNLEGIVISSFEKVILAIEKLEAIHK